MTINQLEYFIAVVEHDSFLDAAESMHISQSSLSKSIQRLEEELDVKLFDRTKRKAALSLEGETFYTGALEILSSYKKSMARLKKVSSRLHGHLRLVTLPILSQYHITEKLRQFTSENSDMELEIDEMEDNKIIHELHDGICDLAIAREELLSNTKFTYYPVAEDFLVAVLPHSHPLAEEKEIALETLAGESFIFMNKYISVYQSCIDACLHSGFTPNVIRTARIESILSAVQAGEGISLLMKKNTDIFHHRDLTFIPLKVPVKSRVVAALPAGKESNKNIRALLKKLKE